MPTFKLDGKPIPFEQGDTIIKAAYRQGIEIPHYCWHPGLSVAANCRMCLVEIMPPENQRAIMLDIMEWDSALGDYRPTRKPKLQPACQMAPADGMDVRSDSSKDVGEARHAVQEFLLLNHPVDCPICDQAGECRLQDYWLEHQKTGKRMRDEPVHKPKAVVFGPTIVYDAERCVMCTRCIRFMDEVAHDPVLSMRERGNLNEIVVAPSRQLDGHYTFMTEHVCPVGALTTKDFRFKARVWFLKSAKSICQGCATGCNAELDFDPRYNKVQRYRPRDNEQVNRYWMCDEGMMTYHRAHLHRVVEPRVSGKPVAIAAALDEAKRLLAGVPTESIAVVLSAQHSLEDNWAMRELASTFLATARMYFSGMGEGYEDKILIHRDKNPNTEGVRSMAPKAGNFAALAAEISAGRVTHVLALGGPTPSVVTSLARDEATARNALNARGTPPDPMNRSGNTGEGWNPSGISSFAAQGDDEADVSALRGLRVLITVASHEGAFTRAAHVVLPAASWAEASGTYVNAKGMRQLSEAAIQPQGASKPGWQQIAALGRALGFDADWSRIKDVRSRLMASVHPTAGEGGTEASP